MLNMATTQLAGIGLGPWEIVAIVAVVLIVFGVGRLPQALGSLGKGVRAFKRGVAGEDIDEDIAASKKKETTNEGAGSEKDKAGELKS
jgi:sec-independent protein translocase protein TatA